MMQMWWTGAEYEYVRLREELERREGIEKSDQIIYINYFNTKIDQAQKVKRSKTPPSLPQAIVVQPPLFAWGIFGLESPDM